MRGGGSEGRLGGRMTDCVVTSVVSVMLSVVRGRGREDASVVLFKVAAEAGRLLESFDVSVSGMAPGADNVALFGAVCGSCFVWMLLSGVVVEVGWEISWGSWESLLAVESVVSFSSVFSGGRRPWRAWLSEEEEVELSVGISEAVMGWLWLVSSRVVR